MASAPTAARLTSAVSPRIYGYAHRSLGDAQPTVCIQEWIAVTAFDTRTSLSQTSLTRVYSSAGNDIARVYVDGKGRLWTRSDWGGNASLSNVTVAADGSWHLVQLCVTTAADSASGSLSAWWDGSSIGTLTGVDNSPDPLASMDIGDNAVNNSTLTIDEVVVGTTLR